MGGWMAASRRTALNRRKESRNTKRIIVWDLLQFVEFAHQVGYNMFELRLI
jgi:hypothetical protein